MNMAHQLTSGAVAQIYAIEKPKRPTVQVINEAVLKLGDVKDLRRHALHARNASDAAR